MIGHATHRDWVAVSFTSGSQRYIQHLAGALGIIKEEFVKVTHTIENNIVWMLGFNAQILLHHGSVWCWGRFHSCLNLTIVRCYVAPAFPGALNG